MKINYITLKNFRQYQGEQTIHFATDNDRNVTIIHGVNGAGKTSLCIALNWCLYDNDFVLEKFGQIGELVSKHHLVSITGDGTSVSVGFTYQNERYLAERQYVNQEETSFTLKKEGETNPFTDDDNESNIESIIPKEISIHFFFDGEKINNFALPGNEQIVKDAVFNVLKIEAISRSITHLESVRNEYNRDLNKARKQQPVDILQTLLDKKANLETKQDDLVNSNAEKRREIVNAKKQIKDIDNRLERNKASQELAEDRKNIEAELKQFKISKSDIEEKILEYANQGYVPMAKPAIDKALDILGSMEAPGVPESVLQELLQQMRCLCGRSIQQKSEEHQNLLSLLNKTANAKSTTIINDTYHSLKYVSHTLLIEIPEGLKSVLLEDQELSRKIASHDARLSDISEKLKDFNEINISNLQKDRDRTLTKIGELRQKIQNNQNEISEIKKDIDRIRKEIESTKSACKTLEKLSHYVVLAENTLKAMGELKELFAEDMRERIQPKVEKIFKQLVWKSSTFKKVRLSSEFELQVIDSFGAEAKPELSAGERQVLSLAFIMAIAQVATEEMLLDTPNEPYPIIMDTPFGKLSKNPIQNITKTLPEIAEQLILFVTDTELNDDARKNLKKRIGKEYDLDFNQANSATSIIPIE